MILWFVHFDAAIIEVVAHAAVMNRLPNELEAVLRPRNVNSTLKRSKISS